VNPDRVTFFLTEGQQEGERPRTAKSLTFKEIKERNRTFRTVSKINLKRAQELKRPPYKPPNKSLMRSQYSDIFSEANTNKEAATMHTKLSELNVVKGPYEMARRYET